MQRSATLIGLFVTLMAPLSANAYNWVINGSSCVPDNSAIQANLYLDTGGSTKHQSTAIGDIILYCPIPAPDLIFNGRLNRLIVTYADSDGKGTVANVTAQLIRVSHNDGSLTMIGNKLDSNSFGPTSGGEMEETLSGGFFNGFDYFYVRIDINRTSTAQSATLFGVTIESL